MQRTGLGGISPFDTRTRPNAFTPLSADNTIYSKGESMIWLQFQPCPCSPQDRVPDCRVKGCYDGYIRSTPEKVLMKEEVAWKQDGNDVFTRYTPIHSIDRIFVGDDKGGTPLTVRQVHDDHVTVAEHLKFWYQVNIDYWVKMGEEEFFEIEGQNERRLTLPVVSKGKIILEVFEVFQDGKPLKWLGHTFDSIMFADRITGTIRGKIKTFSSIKVGYKTSKHEARETQQTGIKFNAGDVDVVPPSYINFGEGDIITTLYNQNRVSQYVPARLGEYDRLTHSPIARVTNCFSRKNGEIIQHYEGDDFVIVGYDRIQWLQNKPTDGYSIMYDYHPSFRITSVVEGGGAEDRTKPRMFKAKVISSYNSLQPTNTVSR